MEKYYNDNKIYNVDEVNLYGAIINVNGTSITDFKRMYELTNDVMYKAGGYSVFCDSDELFFNTFDEAYDFAMNKQKDTFSLM